jgi:hypothetical protein
VLPTRQRGLTGELFGVYHDPRTIERERLEALLGWDVIGWIIGFLIPIGVGVLALGEFRTARICFAISAMILWAKLIEWNYKSNLAVAPRVLVCLVASAMIGWSLFKAFNWVDSKRTIPLIPDQKLAEGELAHNTVPGDAGDTPPPPRHGERIFLPDDITPEYLSCLYNNHTQLQVDALAAPYLGKWMKLSGSVHDIERQYLDRYTVTLWVSGRRKLSTLTFQKEWKDRVSILKRESDVTAIGRLRAIYKDGLALEDCEL